MTTFDIHRHGSRYAPEYPPDGNSDHLPMAWLALAGLGASEDVQARFTETYLPRLAPLPPSSALAARIETLTERIRREGTAAVLGERLPQFISGWYREAYHPLLRLAYGVEFDVPREVAAGLAYMERTGASERLAALARAARPAPGRDAIDVFRDACKGAGRAGVPRAAGDDFTARAEAVLAGDWIESLAVEVEDDLRQFSLAALGAFSATHDFFALHLVTASHAFRVVSPWTGPQGTAVFNLGLLTGYLAIGGPAFDPVPAGPEVPPGRRELLDAAADLTRNDPEHRIKLAYACWRHAGHWNEPAYLATALRYLNAR